jgi:adenylate kinase
MTVIVLLGAPGAGKGTQGAILKDQLGLAHVATGDLFRAAVRDGSPVGLEARRYMERGQLVPDDITIRMLLARLAQDDAASGILLDGFPRNRTQAASLDQALAEHDRTVDLALLIDVPSEDLVERMSGRWICEAAGHVYNEHTNPPLSPGVCDLDGSPLMQRADDQTDTIRARLALQLEGLRDVVAHYAETGVLRTIDGRGDIDEVAAALLRAIDPDGKA